MRSQAAGLPPDGDIRRILEQRVQAIAGPEGGMGIVVGVLDEKGPRVVAYGDTGGADRRPLSGDTAFEIASVSKVFTALLLADMVRTGDLALTDPAAKYLPPSNGLSMTLVDLATHTAGLPFMPDNLTALMESPAASYSKSDLYGFIASRPVSNDIGSKWAYSNLDYWLLQEVIAARAGADFGQVLQSRLLTPLGLRNTAATWSPELKARAAAGHDAALQPAPDIASLPVFNLMPAAGEHGFHRQRSAEVPEHGDGLPGHEARAQHGRAAADTQISGRTRAGAGMVDHRHRRGCDRLPRRRQFRVLQLTCLAAAATRRCTRVVESDYGCGRHCAPSVATERAAGQPKRARRTEITLDAAVLDRYVGRYDMQDEGVVVIGRQGTLLTIELPASWGLPKLRLRAEKEREFFTTELPLQATFEVDANGRVTGMLVHPPRGAAADSRAQVVITPSDKTPPSHHPPETYTRSAAHRASHRAAYRKS